MIHLFFCFWLLPCGQSLKNVRSALCLFVWSTPWAARESSYTVCMVPEPKGWSRLVNWSPPAGELDETAGKATGCWSPKTVVRMKWKCQAEDPNGQIINFHHMNISRILGNLSGQCSNPSFLYWLLTFTRIQEGSWVCTSSLHVFCEPGEGLRPYPVICPIVVALCKPVIGVLSGAHSGDYIFDLRMPRDPTGRARGSGWDCDCDLDPGGAETGWIDGQNLFIRLLCAWQQWPTMQRIPGNVMR